MQNQIPKIVRKAYGELLLRDSFLLKNDASERSIMHRFALYLEKYFPDYHVDCEYNRDGMGSRPKVLRNLVERAEGLGLKMEKPRKVYPDIVVHRRGETTGVLAVEFQKSNKSKKQKDYDALKLKAYKDELGYSFAFSITLPIKKTLNIRSVGDLIEQV